MLIAVCVQGHWARLGSRAGGPRAQGLVAVVDTGYTGVCGKIYLAVVHTEYTHGIYAVYAILKYIT